MDQMGRVPQQHTALVECLTDERDISLGQVADPAVDQFGAPARGAVSEVGAFEQDRAVAPPGRVDGRSQPRGPASDDYDVPGRLVVQSREVLGASE